MLTIHHLGKSQSERILWLCEELGVPYELKRYTRDAVTMLSPPELKALHPLGAAPVITDGDLLLAESGAIVDYILAKYGDGRLVVAPDHPDFAQYLYWFHFANGNFQPNMGRNMLLRRLDLPSDNAVLVGARGRLALVLDLLEARLGEVDHLAGAELTAADIMLVFSLTTMRYFYPLDISPYPNMLAYLRRIAAREAYQRAMQKGDPGMPLLLS
ncbi:MAG: glutathione S-transferase family protein [Comamonadaceae bacterium]|nr:MAG: glutathione S-transferase family protein [Comamonadaceae bacterium]